MQEQDNKQNLSPGQGRAVPLPRLQCQNITQRFPGILALSDVSLDVMPGEVHILFGENGAGKSTLISIISGARRPTGGNLLMDGRSLQLDSVLQARKAGIGAVFQEFSLVPQLTVAENLFLGAELIRNGRLDRRGMIARTALILKKWGFNIHPETPVQHLTRGEQQMVEICKAFQNQLSILILDEPTASLTESEKEKLFTLVREIRQRGVGIIYITHRMHEIQEIGDRITILRDGTVIDTVPATLPQDDLVQLMTGRVIDAVYPSIPHQPGPPVLDIRQLTTRSGRVQDVSLQVHAGEIVGIAGMVGSGKSEIGRACYGIEKIAAGGIVFNDKPLLHLNPAKALRHGIFYLPPDRKAEGLVLNRSGMENISLPALHSLPLSRNMILNRRQEKSWSAMLAARVHFPPGRLGSHMSEFSGGNQQKVMLAKGLAQPISLYIFDEPTVGVDVVTRATIYQFFKTLCEQGAAILLISSDLPEVMNLSHRLYVTCDGRISAELSGADINEDQVISHFFEREAPMNAPSHLTTTPEPRRSMPWYRLLSDTMFIRGGVLPLMVFAAVAIFTVMKPEFLTFSNLTNLLRQSVYLVIVALAQMLALVAGGLDLSVGSILALTSVVSVMVMTLLPDSPWLAITLGSLAGITVGTLVGMLNGAGVALMRIPPFMMTLGVSSVIIGITLFLSGGVSIYGMPDIFGVMFGFGDLFGIPYPVLTAFILVALVYLMMNWTTFGRHLYATGGSPRAAELSGVPTTRVLFITYVLVGTITAISGLLLTARLGTGESTIGLSMPLESIAACVIAGVSLSGGSGRVGNVVLGAIFINIVQNGMNLIQVGAYMQTIILGALLILAVTADRLRIKTLVA